MMDEKIDNPADSYDIGISSGLIRRWAEALPRRPRRRSQSFSSFQVELPSRRWLKIAASEEGWN